VISEEREVPIDIGDILNRDRAILNAIEEGTFYDKDLITKDWKDWYKGKDHLHTEHINFDDIVKKYSQCIGLKGQSYRPLTKFVFYNILSNSLKNNYFSVNGKKKDLRIPIMIFLKSGHGKKDYSNFIKNTTKSLDKQYSEPSSYHPEQFIGKIIITDHGKDGIEYTPVYGILESDYVLIDEGKILLTSNRPEYQESLKYIRESLDPIGSNELGKKQVNVPYEEQLRYFPNCNISIFSQPLTNVNEELINKGDFRRFILVVPTIPEVERDQAFNETTFNSKSSLNQDDWNKWIILNKVLENRTGLNFTMSDEYLINDFLSSLKTDNISTPVKVYLTNSMFDLKYFLYRMSMIRAIIDQIDNTDIKISEKHIKPAIEDFKSIWQGQVRWLSQQMNITSDKPLGWKDDLHGWIIESLTGCPNGIEQKVIIETYCEKYKGSKAKSTLTDYIYKGMKDLRKWGMVETKVVKKNGKLFRLKQYRETV